MKLQVKAANTAKRWFPESRALYKAKGLWKMKWLVGVTAYNWHDDDADGRWWTLEKHAELDVDAVIGQNCDLASLISCVLRELEASCEV